MEFYFMFPSCHPLFFPSFFSFLSPSFPRSYEYVEHGTARSEGNPSVFFIICPAKTTNPRLLQMIVVRCNER